jgi:hypothetical protein
MFPERPSFDIVDKTHGRKIHVVFPLPINNELLGNISRAWRARKRPFYWHRIIFSNGRAVLRRTENVRQE